MVACFAATLLITGCRCTSRSSGRSPTPSEAERALTLGVQWLLERQDPDGSWRSTTYGAFKDGDALTPLVVRTLGAAPSTPETQAAIEKGIGYLEALAEHAPDTNRIHFPGYTSSLAVEVLPDSPARTKWLAHVQSRQLTTDLGWSESDKEFGGWGYAVTQPIKPEPGELAPPLIESNLSATAFAIDALAAAGALEGVCADALVFAATMQNSDGGFHFIYDDPVRNKAGGVDDAFHSYGSTSADGLRVMHHCKGEGKAAAARWLHEHFDGRRHPGTYEAQHEPGRDGLYFYWAASAARAFTLVPEAAPKGWQDELLAGVIARQAEDGSWQNAIPTMRENDKLVATSFAVYALSLASAPEATSSER